MFTDIRSVLGSVLSILFILSHLVLPKLLQDRQYNLEVESQKHYFGQGLKLIEHPWLQSLSIPNSIFKRNHFGIQHTHTHPEILYQIQHFTEILQKFKVTVIIYKTLPYLGLWCPWRPMLCLLVSLQYPAWCFIPSSTHELVELNQTWEAHSSVYKNREGWLGKNFTWVNPAHTWVPY